MDTMNYQKACKILGVSESATVETIRKQYKLMALKFHPDKNKSPNANAEYQEIKEAHDYLMTHFSAGVSSSGSWSASVASFFETLYNNENLQKRVFHPLLTKIVETCETEIFEKMDSRRAQKIYNILLKYRDYLHLSVEFMDRVLEIISKKEMISEIIILNPNLEDLFNQSVYRLRVADEVCLVPLWHSELIYEKHNLQVQCEPELPENVQLDEYNNLHVWLKYEIRELWGKDTVEFNLGERVFQIRVDLLKMKIEQFVVIEGKGIPVLNETNIFGVERISDIYAHIEIYMDNIYGQ